MSRRQYVLTLGSAVATLIAAVALVLHGPSASAATSVFTPVADTYVDSSAPAAGFGTSMVLTVDKSPVKRTFLRFTVANLTGSVTGVKLRLHTDSGSGAGSSVGGTLQSLSDLTWSEAGTTWSNQPAIDGPTLGSLGSVARNTWYEIDVTPAVAGNGTFSFAFTSASNNGADYDSRETGSLSPQLSITTDVTTTTSMATTTTSMVTTTTTPVADPVLLGAGDIASCASTGDEATAAVVNGQPGTVFTTGDNAYEAGTPTEYTNCYDPSWGAFKARTRPAPGNHDYGTSGATGYYGYFGAAAGPAGQGYYSYDLGNWHLVSLNSNCTIVSCAAGSAQEQWLRADLAATTKPCVAAYWHHPRFSSGTSHGSSTTVQPLWQALYDFNADLVLAGHEHNYERFAPLTPTGAVDTVRGIRSFVVGTGGRSHYGFGTPITGSEVRDSTTFGALKLTLHAGSFDWSFLPVAGQTFTDSGTQACH